MDRYQRVEKPRPQSAAIGENEIRITTQGLIRNYVNYATSLLQESHMKEIVLKAMGQAISKTVAVAEFVKKRFPHLHQDTVISSVSITDVWEPIEEGLVPLEMTRHVSMISVALSTREPNKKGPGYQAPVHVQQPKHQQKFQQPQQSQQQQQYQYRQALGQLNEDSYGRGSVRGRGRGRGWGRGGYGGYGGYANNQGGYGGYNNNQGGYGGNYNQGGYGGYENNQENGGWNSNWNRGGGRGRGGWNSRGAGYGGRGGGGRNGGRGYGNGRGRMGGRGRAN
uniref:DNA/RNA-binding protein Alba-like domain-containing protein n=1 Tax=Musa acuminata subsp. malaccensis TaxID=214687 RepID=A0A804ING9_MUSAM|nr:PREDICTED: protein FAM98A [Musa acuminata subsp. malaccensis]